MNLVPQLIIPMTGVGQRFVNAGYRELKPLIDTGMGTMIQGVLENYQLVEDPLFVISDSHPQKADLKRELTRLRPKGKVIEISSHKRGPSYAVWEARSNIDSKRPVIVNYCDFSGIWSETDFYAQLVEVDGLIATYTGFHPHMVRNTSYAYVLKIGDRVKGIQEKRSFTENPMNEEASSGTYGFGSGEILLDALSEQMKRNLSLNGELYTSLTYIPLIEKDAAIKTFQIDKFFQWGTPEDLEDFRFWEKLRLRSLSKNMKVKEERKSVALILAGGSGNRLRGTANVPKPQIQVFGKQLWKFAAEASKTCKETYVFTTSDQLEGMQKSLGEPIVFISIDKPTESQTDSAYEALNRIAELNHPIHILASDNILFEEELAKVESLLHDCDVVAWTKCNYAASQKKPFHYSWVNSDERRDINHVYIKPENRPDSNEILIGNFSFRDGTLARRLIDKIRSEQIVMSEKYLDYVVIEALNLGLTVKAHAVNDFWAIGTLEEFDTLKYWEEAFAVPKITA